MTDGPKPHVGGPILPPGIPTVLISGLPASNVGNLCLCVSPAPDSIVMGSGTVFIGGAPAARFFDKTAHGGSIVFGAGTVLIGDFAAVSSMNIFPGQQNYGNCGVQSSQQIIHQATGDNPSEDAILKAALDGGYADDSDVDFERGSTSASDREDLLRTYRVDSHVVHNPSKEDLAEALKDNRGVIANVDAGELWNDEAYRGGGHAVLVSEGDFNEQGELTHVYINDTGTGQQGQRIAIDEMMSAMQAREGGYEINVTDAPIWTQVR
jgi:uncharacterized Zn-binding protein involved in type VI secretion